MADSHQAIRNSSLNLPTPPCVQKAFNAHYSGSAPHQQNNSNNAQTAGQDTPSISKDNDISVAPNNLRPPVSTPATPTSSRPATPTLLPGFASTDLHPTAPNQPPPPSPPPYKTPYAQSEPFPAAGTQIQAPSPVHPPSTSHTYAQPRSAASTPAPMYSDPALQRGISSTPGYLAYAQQLRQTNPATQYKVRSGRLSPVSHVRNALSIVSDTGYVPPELRRLSGVMAGNPMINSVKVIQYIAEGYEDVCDKLDDRDATIRQLRAEKAQMQAEHARKTQHAVDDALRFSVRPQPQSTAQHVADLKNRDDKIKALEAFVSDQAQRITNCEAARDHAQNMQLDLKNKQEQEMAAEKKRSENYRQDLATEKDRCKKLAEELSAAQNHAQQCQDFIQTQASNQDNGIGQDHGHPQIQGEGQIFGQDQALLQPQGFGQGSEVDFDKFFASLHPEQEQHTGFHHNADFTQQSQQSFDDQLGFLQQPSMPGFPRDPFFPQTMSFGQVGGNQANEDPFTMGDHCGNLFQHEESARRARTVEQSFGLQNMPFQQGLQSYQTMRGQGQAQNQRNSLTPGRHQRIQSQVQQSPASFHSIPGQNQHSPPRRQQTPGQAQRNAKTPDRGQAMEDQQSPPRSQGSQKQGQRAASMPIRQPTPQPARGKRGHPTKNSDQVSAQQNANVPTAQQLASAYQNNHYSTPQANQALGPARRTTQTRGPRKPSAETEQNISNHQLFPRGNQSVNQHDGLGLDLGHDGSHDNMPLQQGIKRGASSLDEQQEGEEGQPAAEVRKVTLDTFRRTLRQRIENGEIKIMKNYQRSF
ncbi:hypothetical protein ONS95_001393 [Cadophora gregata]|uniref:uncharacterized protein n=1 Tax=Cadophora gregata TaxID=51156 RepID=UPI0026DC8AAB|nr:uncharacterized protein ONS95_001393 [Cadophora gregata]KAK0111013.1 hypothetical protein ONS95_001393 [Cadophora gregata]